MQLFLNGQELDISPDERIAITMQINDLADISKTNTSFSNIFKAPKTANNVRVMEYLGVQGSSTRIPYKLNNVTLLEDSIVLLNNGFAEITETTDKYYNINIYGSEKTFFEKIRQLTIKDTYGLRNIYWTADNLRDYLNNTIDFTFPVAQYSSSVQSGSLQTSGSVFIRTKAMETSPHFFIKNLFEKVFEYLDYTVDYPMENDSVFTKLAMPSQKGVSHFDVVHGDLFNVQNCVPEMQCDDFLREIMQRYGLVIQVDEIDKKVQFLRMDDLITDGEILDWTDKYVRLKSEKYNVGKYGQVNYFKYSEDVENESTLNPVSANELQGTFELDNETLDKENTIIESNFEKPKYAKYSETNDYALGRIFFHTTGEDYFLLDVSERETQEGGDTKNKEMPFQIAYVYYIGTLSYSFIDPDNTLYTRSVNARAVNYDNIDWQTFIDNNYNQVINLLDNMQVIKVMMKLTTLDIYTFNFFNRIYLEQYGSYFYVNKISNFEKNKITEVELIKIPPIQ